MKDQFREHYKYSDKELKALWDEAFFVFDTNTLLNMYRYNRETFKEYVKVLKELSKNGKLFMPNQVGEEFFRNRMKVIQDYKKSYEEILKMISAFKGQLSSRYRHHPFVDIQQLSSNIEKALQPTEKSLEKTQKSHPDWIQDDNILDELTKIFSNCTGDPFSDEEKAKIFEEGEVRYEKKIPPGFKDADKEGERQYGDLLVWKQILAFAKDKKKPIVFITGDEKEDWWLLSEGKRLMPLPSLKREMRTVAGVDFHAYTADYFLETYNEHNTSKTIDTKAIEEVRRLREIQDLMETEITDYKSRGMLYREKELNQKYELFVLSINKLFEIVDHSRLLIPSSSHEALARLEFTEQIIRELSKKIRMSHRINPFYMRKLSQNLLRMKMIFSEQAIQSDDESVSRQLERYSIEIDKIRELLETGGISA